MNKCSPKQSVCVTFIQKNCLLRVWQLSLVFGPLVNPAVITLKKIAGGRPGLNNFTFTKYKEMFKKFKLHKIATIAANLMKHKTANLPSRRGGRRGARSAIRDVPHSVGAAEDHL